MDTQNAHHEDSLNAGCYISSFTPPKKKCEHVTPWSKIEKAVVPNINILQFSFGVHVNRLTLSASSNMSFFLPLTYNVFLLLSIECEF